MRPASVLLPLLAVLATFPVVGHAADLDGAALSPLWGLALPAIALQYLIFTLDSAYQYMQGRGGTWKGRVQANVSGS